MHPLRYFLFFLISIICALALVKVALAGVRSRKLPTCPNCGRAKVRRSRLHTSVDHLLAALHLPPFKCDACLKRFYAFGRPRAHEPVEPMEAHSHRA
jgi:hypothetical protein